MAKADSKNQDRQLDRELKDLRRTFDDFRALLTLNLDVSKTALENSDRAVGRMTWIAGIAMLFISILTTGVVGFGIWSTLGLPAEAKDQVGTQVPPVVASQVAESVPKSVRDEIATQVPFALEQLRSTVIAEIVPTAYANIQTQSAIAASTAVQETSGNFIIVISSDLELEEATFELEKAKRLGYDPVVYKIGDYYATTVGRYFTEEQLRTDLEKVRTELEPRAYFLDLSISCPFPRFFNAGFYGCFSEPQD